MDKITITHSSTKDIAIESCDKKLLLQIKKDDFNSLHFNLSMGNMNIDAINENIDDELIKDIIGIACMEAKNKGFKHLTCKIDTNIKDIVYYLEKEEFYLMDTLVTYVFSYNKCHLNNVDHRCIIRDCRYDDLETLKEIAKKSFKIDRFHSDKLLDEYKCDEYYEKWVENSYNGFADNTIVAEIDGMPVGFTTCKLPNSEDKSKTGQLVLSAVSECSRGKGVYTSMIYAGVKWLEGKANDVRVGTQINNTAVQKSWIKLGFTVLESQYVFHKILE